MKDLVKSFKADPAWYSLLFFVFFAGVSMPIARVFLLVSTVCVATKAIRAKQWPHFSLPSKGWLAYFGVAIILSIIATIMITEDPYLNPTKGLSKIDKLVWYLGIPLVALLVDSKERFVKLLRWFVLGCVIAAILVFVTYTINAWVMTSIPHPNEMKDEIYRQSIPLTSQWLYHVTHFFGTFNGIWDDIRQFSRTRPDSFSIAFLLQGTMHESQRLMVAIPAAFFLFIDAFKQQLPRKQCFMRLIALILIALALIMTCKRGPLLTAFILMLPIAFCYFKRGTILTIALLVAIVFLVPASRTRVLAIPDEFSAEKGGRYAMWTQIVPNIHEDYPLGIGFRTLTSEKMRYYCPNMEKRPHSHVHSTPLQVFVEFSWIGIIAYSLWVLLTIIPSIVYWRRGAGLYAIIPLAMACSLLLFGLVEYNLADGEIVLLYSIGMGLCDCAYLNTQFGKQTKKSE